jgi:glycerophosphoryl diester phosphodiesterase
MTTITAMTATVGLGIAAPLPAPLGAGAATATAAAPRATRQAHPLVIAHRGASGYRPEHTLASYRLGIELGADYVEPDLVSTRDGVLVARHENDITGTTDVADHPEFADRRTTKTVDGRQITGWFTEDFTLAELRTLRAVERVADVRPSNTRYDGRFTIPTFDEVLDLVRRESRRTGRRIGVYPETKHPTYFASIGLPLEEPLVAALRRHDLDRRGSNVFIQSFETTNLRELKGRTDVSLIQLLDASGAPADLVAQGDRRRYADLLTPAGLRQIARYADGVGAHKDLVLPRDPRTGATGEPSTLVRDAHERDLLVHVWTLRDENRFLATNFRRGSDPAAKGDAIAEATAFLDAGVDGIFTDQPDTTVEARREWWDASARAS